MWFKEYGWKENPFSIKSNTTLFGIESKKKHLLNFIQSGDICWLTGTTGVGKSSILKWIEKNLKSHSVYYIDAASVQPSFSITKYLTNKNSIFNKIAGNKFPRNTVILVDESQECNKELVKALKLHWDHKNIKSIVVTQIDNLNNFNLSFKDRIGKRIITMGKISKSDACELIKFRAGDKNPFDKASMEYLIEQAECRPRKILELCEITCAKMAGKKRFINIFDTEAMLKEPIRLEPPKMPKLNKINNKLSPMQKKIVDQLSKEDKTAKELASLLDTSEGSVGKQLSKLIKSKKVNITKQDRPKKYGLT